MDSGTKELHQLKHLSTKIQEVTYKVAIYTEKIEKQSNHTAGYTRAPRCMVR